MDLYNFIMALLGVILLIMLIQTVIRIHEDGLTFDPDFAHYGFAICAFFGSSMWIGFSSLTIKRYV